MSFLIIRNLPDCPWRFNGLQKNLEGFSQKVLTDSLRSMEADGIITRTVYPVVPPRVEYAISELDESCAPCSTPCVPGAMDIRRFRANYL